MNQLADFSIRVRDERYWTLTLCPKQGEAPTTHRLATRTLVVGRGADVEVRVPHVSVSRKHAEIALVDGCPTVRDLGSANGTFVNGRRIDAASLCADDFLQFGDVVFRVARVEPEDVGGTMQANSVPWAQALLQFDSLMSQERLTPHFQPIVTLPEGERIGFELLARSDVEGLETPGKMFAVAESLSQERALSELLRRCGSRAASAFARPFSLFVNSHPAEVGAERLLSSLAELRDLAPDLEIVIEVHEAAVTDPATIRRLREGVDRMGMRLAYDDFGAGQSRLEELTAVPPDYLKFDMSLIRGIDKAPEAKRDLVASLIRVAKSLGVTTLAEGIETAEEAAVSADLGFELAQGYFFGKPAPPESFL